MQKFIEFYKREKLVHTVFPAVGTAVAMIRPIVNMNNKKEAIKECQRAIEVIETGIRRERSKLLRNMGTNLALPAFRLFKEVVKR